jgi:hypothetical protein
MALYTLGKYAQVRVACLEALQDLGFGLRDIVLAAATPLWSSTVESAIAYSYSSCYLCYSCDYCVICLPDSEILKLDPRLDSASSICTIHDCVSRAAQQDFITHYVFPCNLHISRLS